MTGFVAIVIAVTTLFALGGCASSGGSRTQHDAARSRIETYISQCRSYGYSPEKSQTELAACVERLDIQTRQRSSRAAACRSKALAGMDSRGRMGTELGRAGNVFNRCMEGLN